LKYELEQELVLKLAGKLMLRIEYFKGRILGERSHVRQLLPFMKY